MQLYFLNDDFVHIPLSKNKIFFQHNTFRPICDLSMQLDYAMWKKNAAGYHLTNLLLHIAVTILVYKTVVLYARRYGLPYAQRIALCTAVLFFVYAHHSEAVFWIIGRSAMLGMIFFLPALIFYAGRGKYAFTGMLVFSWLAWCSYESTWIIWPIAAGISYADCRMGLSTTRKEITRMGLTGVNFLLYLVLRYLIIHEIAGNYEATNLLQGNVALLVMNYAKLLMRCWLPYTGNSFLLMGVAVFLLIALVVFLLYNKYYRKKAWLLPAIALLVALLPYTSLGIDTHGTESERFLYLPSFFACVLLVVLLSSLQSNVLRYTCFVAILAFHMALLYNNASHYRYAGSVTKAFTTSLQVIPAASKLHVDSVPSSCNGALIFRHGLAECIDWMGHGDSLIYHSQKQNGYVPAPSYAMQLVKTNPGNSGQMTAGAEDAPVYMRFADTALIIYLNP